MRASLTAARLVVVLAVLALLAGCGSQLKAGASARASTPGADPGGPPAGPAAAGSCPATVMSTLRTVLQRIYDEGAHSEKTGAAASTIRHSATLRSALEAGDQAAVQSAVKDLLASGRMTALLVRDAAGRQLAVGGVPSLTPVRGTIKGAGGRTIGSYLISVWSYEGFVAEGDGVAQGLLAIRRGEQTLAGPAELPAGPLPAQGSVTSGGGSYRFTTLQASEFPSGAPLTIYVLRASASIEHLCGARAEDTVVNTLSGVANLIYKAEAGARTHVQVRRVQHDATLLHAVAAGDAPATRRAIERLLNQHIVRMRVSNRGGLLADVGGPYVLAPVVAPLRLGGRQIGRVVLSIQDDEGYLRLARRLAGLSVLMYMRGNTLVKNSLGPGVGGLASVPASGRYVYRGRTFRVVTINARAFPSGPLTIRVLIPIPYR